MRLVQANKQFEQDGFSGAATSQDGERFSLRDFQVDAFEDSLLAEGLSERLHTNRRRLCGAVCLFAAGLGRLFAQRLSADHYAPLRKKIRESSEPATHRPG